MPRCRPLFTNGWILIEDSVDIGKELLGVDGRRVFERFDDFIPRRKLWAPGRRHFGNRHAVSSDEKVSPASRARMIAPLSLRSSRWVILRCIVGTVAHVPRDAYPLERR